MEKIAEKHGGLPIANKTATNAVRNKGRNIWPQLKSKSYIRSLELKLFVFLCTMYPEYSRIPIEDLVAQGMGIKLFEGVHDIIGARNRVRDLIDIINFQKGFKLQLEKDEYGNQYIKTALHSHSSKFEFESIIGDFPEKNEYKNSYGLSIALRTISEHTAHWNYPKLALLLHKYRANSCTLPADFFKGMKKLRVLSLDVSSLPLSFNMPKNLRVLRLKVLKLKDISFIGGLVNLEFLTIITSCSVGIPEEMGQLSNLRLLDLRRMKLVFVPPGMLSKLLKLEELYFPLSYGRWGSGVREEADDHDEWETSEEDDCDSKERINAMPNEISALSLNALQICVPKASMMCELPIIKNIQRFKILVLNELKCQLFDKSSMNELQLTGDVCDIKESSVCDLISKTEELSLIRVRNLKNIMYQLDDCQFLQLKKMIIAECDELEYLIDIPGKGIPDSPFLELRILHLSMLSNLKEIWNGTSRTLLYRWFLNLTEIKIRFCHKLKYVFPLSIGRGLLRRKSIEMVDCSEVEGIFYRNEVDDNTDGIYLVEELYLFLLPRFVGFLVQRDSTVAGDCVDTNKLLTTIEVSIMKDKDILSYTEMHCAFSPQVMNERLIRLKKLKIAFCDALSVIFCFEENHAASVGVLNSLEELELYGLRNLKHIFFQIPQNIMAFQRLRLLMLSECHNSYLLTIPIAKLLVQLQKMQINHCEKMVEIIAKEDEKDVEAIIDETVFPRLKVLELHDMRSLNIFSSTSHAMELPSLEFLKLYQCDKMEVFSYGSLSTPMLKKVHIDGSSYCLMGDLNSTLTRLKAEAL